MLNNKLDGYQWTVICVKTIIHNLCACKQSNNKQIEINKKMCQMKH